jgi:23S rRNA pseudouridine955/2504/2580 synthase
MQALSKDSVSWLTVDEGGEDQRIDNFLTRLLKGVPRTHLYRMLRTGQVRVNSKRVDATFRVQVGDRVRIPPVRTGTRARTRFDGAVVASIPSPLDAAILFEDEHLLVVSKPAGLAVHGGSGIARGAIEEMRMRRPAQRYLELVHRLDRDTSGVLLMAKKRSALLALHAALRNRIIRKFYQLLVNGRWPWERRQVSLPLQKYLLAGGDRRVRVSSEGLPASTLFTRLQQFDTATLLEAELLTGRTHQIRVHAAANGHPILGDDKYGDFDRNRKAARQGLKRMFLHAVRVELPHPATGAPLNLQAPLASDLAAFLAAQGARGSGASDA